MLSVFNSTEAAPVTAPDRLSAAQRTLLAHIDTPQVALVSFDVFDTVITRSLGEPAAVFDLVGSFLAARGLDVPVNEFRQLRLDAERRARRNRPGREVTLHEICAELAYALGLDEHVEAFVDAELHIEREVIQPVPGMREVVAHARRKYERVIYISDMYLPQAFIEERLQAFGLLAAADRVYLSSTCGGWKGNGQLFKVVLDAENLAPNQILHCGNSLPVDIDRAGRLGLRTFHLTPANLNISEEILATCAGSGAHAGSWFCAASRRVRLLSTHTLDEQTVWDAGASLTGPMLLMYVSWVLEQARRHRLSHLLFLARDAYLPFVVAQRILAARPELSTELHYVYGSRATYLALAGAGNGELIEITREYVSALGVHEAAGVGIVDTGWSTRSHAPLLDFLAREGCARLRLFYLGMNGVRSAVPDETLCTFLFNRARASGTRDPSFEYPRAFEALLMAPHGRTQGFRRVDGRIEPVLALTDNVGFIERLFPIYEAAILRFVDEALPHLPVHAPQPLYRAAVDRLVRRFWSAPTPAEARVWASLEWESDCAGRARFRLARPYRPRDAWRAFVHKRLPSLYPQFWGEAAAAITPPRTLALLRAAIFARRVLGRLTRLTPSILSRRARALSRRLKAASRPPRESAPSATPSPLAQRAA